MDGRELLRVVRERLRRKRRRALEAFIQAGVAKKTCNCRHQGSPVADQLSGCKILAQGKDHAEAAVCHDLKAQFCPLFSMKKTPKRLALEFRQLTDADRRLRFPALGELEWVEKTIVALDAQGDCDAGSLPLLPSSDIGRGRDAAPTGPAASGEVVLGKPPTGLRDVSPRRS